jgi:hypothetical protein
VKLSRVFARVGNNLGGCDECPERLTKLKYVVHPDTVIPKPDRMWRQIDASPHMPRFFSIQYDMRRRSIERARHEVTKENVWIRSHFRNKWKTIPRNGAAKEGRWKQKHPWEL